MISSSSRFFALWAQNDSKLGISQQSHNAYGGKIAIFFSVVKEPILLLLIALAGGVVSLLWFEGFKTLVRRMII